MALTFGDVAVCGLGASCQTAMQLDEQRGYLEKIFGHPSDRKSTPFDWLICGPSAIARMIAENRFFPDHPSQFSKQPGYTWVEMQSVYLHEKAVASNWNSVASKWAHISANFADIRLVRRKIFVLSVTQNNLLAFGNASLDPGWSTLSDASILAVRKALEARFGEIELHCIAYPERHTLTSSAAIEGLHIFEHDDSPVKGDAGQWKAALAKAAMHKNMHTGEISHNSY